MRRAVVSAYLPAAVLGNGALLATLLARGEVERLIWPHVDSPSNVSELRLGIASAGERGSTRSLRDWRQEWVAADASVLRTTVYSPARHGVVRRGSVDPDKPVLVRRVDARAGTLVVACAPRLGGDTERPRAPSSTRARGAVVFHRRDVALASRRRGVSPRAGVASRGRHATTSRTSGRCGGCSRPSTTASRTSSSPSGRPRSRRSRAPVRTRRRRRTSPLAAVRRTEGAVRRRPPGPRPRPAARVPLFRTLGARARAAERPRDRRDRRGAGDGRALHGVRRLRVRLAARPRLRRPRAARGRACSRRRRPPSAGWLARRRPKGCGCTATGRRASSRRPGDFTSSTRPATGALRGGGRVGAGQLTGLDTRAVAGGQAGRRLPGVVLDHATGLPHASVDLWEQQDGQHAYTAAAVVGGLRASARAGERHGDLEASERASRATADGIAERDRHRALETPVSSAATPVLSASPSRAGTSGHPGLALARTLPYPNRRIAGVEPLATRRSTARCSGSTWPFAALDPAVGARLRADRGRRRPPGSADPAGGLRRQAGDTYAGGHEWPLATLWLGLARRMLGEEPALREAAVPPVVQRRRTLDLLPEQAGADGRPAWVLPLGWSHAMLLLAARPELRLVARLHADHGNAGDGQRGMTAAGRPLKSIVPPNGWPSSGSLATG